MKNFKNFFAFLAVSFGLVAGVWMLILMGQGCYYKWQASPRTWEEKIQFVDIFAEVFLPYGYMALGLVALSVLCGVVYEKLDAEAWKISKT